MPGEAWTHVWAYVTIYIFPQDQVVKWLKHYYKKVRALQ